LKRGDFENHNELRMERRGSSRRQPEPDETS